MGNGRNARRCDGRAECAGCGRANQVAAGHEAPLKQIGLQIPRRDHPEWWLRQSSKMAIEKSFLSVGFDRAALARRLSPHHDSIALKSCSRCKRKPRRVDPASLLLVATEIPRRRDYSQKPASNHRVPSGWTRTFSHDNLGIVTGITTSGYGRCSAHAAAAQPTRARPDALGQGGSGRAATVQPSACRQ